MPSSLSLSKRKLICRSGTAAGHFRGSIVCLPNDDDIAPRVCGVVRPAQQPLQLDQCHDIDARRARGHDGAVNRVKHPAGHGDHNAGRPLHQEKLAARSLLNAAHEHPEAEIRMPTIMDVRFLPDMGRMNGWWPWAGKTT